jgi:DNA repair photolyase
MPGNSGFSPLAVTVQTRSPLVLRDIDLLSRAENFEVGFSVTTADDNIRKMFEPLAPPISERIRALDELHKAGIKTFVMIAPLLPAPKPLPAAWRVKLTV